uniref:uncharacterized protein isoform X2 n=1 Tax=Myxine glutinosa TaxID=7769 RepID=UPI00358EEDA3
MCGTMNASAILLVCCLLTLTLAKPFSKHPGGPRPRYGKDKNDDMQGGPRLRSGMKRARNSPLGEGMREICEKVQNHSAVNMTLSPELLQKCSMAATGKPPMMTEPEGLMREYSKQHPRKTREIEGADVPPSGNPNRGNPPMGLRPTGEPPGAMHGASPKGHVPQLSVTGLEDLVGKMELHGDEDDENDDDDEDSKEEVENEEDDMDDEEEEDDVDDEEENDGDEK